MTMVMFSSPSYMMILFTDMRGNFLLLVAAALMSLGVFVMKRMISFKI
jgi:tight adherence protein B